MKSRVMNRAELKKLAYKGFAVLTALALALSQTSINFAVAAAEESANNEVDAVQVGAIDVGLEFNHTYIEYQGQIVSAPATKLTVAEGSELEFSVMPDNGYEVSSVVLTSGSAEYEIAPDASGVYVVEANQLTDGLTIVASAAPVLEEDEAVLEDEAAEPVVEDEQAVEPEEAVEEQALQAGENAAEYVYSDNDVTVTVTLSEASALPEGAELRVTPVTPDTQGYNYDAYMDALNANGEGYSSENTLLYDIAFIVDGVEVQPAEGTAKVNIEFKSEQLSSDIQANEGSEVEVNHLPLVGEAKDAAASTEQATDISASDIAVEGMVAKTTVDGSNQKTEFTTDSFSMYSVTTTPLRAGSAANNSSVSAQGTLESAASDSIIVQFNRDSGNAGNLSGNYYLLMILEHGGSNYYALSEALNTSGATEVTPTVFAQPWGNNAQFSPGDTVSAAVINQIPADWQIDGYLKGGAPNGFTPYPDGADLGNGWTVSIEIPKAWVPADSNYDGNFDENANDVTVRPDPVAAYTVSVNTYGYGGTSLEAPEPTMSDQFYALVTLTSKETGNIRGWALEKFDINNAMPAELEFTEFWKAEPGFETNSVIYYDSNVYNADARIFHSPNKNLSSFYAFKGKNATAIDTVEGYTFDKQTNDNGASISLTREDERPFVVELNFDGANRTITEDSNYYVYVTVGHQTSGYTSAALVPLVTNGTSRVQIPVYHWYKANDGSALENEHFLGTESSVQATIVKVFSKQYATVQSVNSNQRCIKYENGDSFGGLTVSYEAMKREGDAFAPTDGMFVLPISLSEQGGVSADYTYRSVLGGGAAYGVTANEFEQKNDLQTNFATNLFKRTEHSVNPNLSGHSGSIVMAWAEPGNYNSQLFLAEANADTGSVIVYAGRSDKSVLQDERSYATVVQGDRDTLSANMVEPIIQHGDEVSAAMSAHDATAVPENWGMDKVFLDTTAYPSDATIYIDGDALARAGKLTDGKLLISKQEDQVIVFNFKSTETLKLGQYYVNYPDMSPYSSNVSIADQDDGKKYIKVESPTGKCAQNDALDGIARHIVWNCASVKNLELNITAGMYLIPRDVSETTIAGTSAGWIISDGYVCNTGGEWHSIYSDLPDVDTAHLVASKTVDGNRPTAEQRFNFSFDRYNAGDRTWSKIEEIENEGGTVSTIVEGMTPGWNVFRITETSKAADTEGSFILDTKPIYAVVNYALNEVGNYWYASLPTYYNNFDPAAFDAQAANLVGLSDPTTSPTIANRTSSERTASGSIQLKAHKELKGGTLSIGQFEFVLTDAQGAELDRQRNDADGNVTFVAQRYDLSNAGSTYEYKIREVAPSDDGDITYDRSPKTVTVTVSDNGTEALDVVPNYGDGADAATFTNTLKARGQVQIKAHKELRGDTLSGGQFEFVLTDAQGKEVGRKSNDGDKLVTFDAIEYTSDQLPFSEDQVDADGHQFVTLSYTITEVIPGTNNPVTSDGNVVVGNMLYDGTSKTVNVTVTNMGDGTLRATYEDPEFTGATFTNNREKTSVSGTKTWNDDSNRDGIRPAKIVVNLLANGEVIQSKEVSGEGDVWSYSFDNLDKYKNGQQIEYTVSEESIEYDTEKVTSGYRSEPSGMNLVNTHVIEKTSIKAKKVWKDEGNPGGRPESAKLELVAGGVPTGKTKIVNEAGGWEATWSDLPKYDAGKEIKYEVTEVEVPDGYQFAVTGSAADGFTVTNTLTEGKTSVKVTKVWNDSSNHDNLRPDSVTVALKADGEKYGEAVTFGGEGDSWTYTWTDLPKFNDGKTIVYTVEEEGDTTGYITANPTGNATDGFTITNKHDVQKTSVTVTKEWNDYDNNDDIQPASVSVKLMKVVGEQGKEQVGNSVVLNADNDWTATWEGLDALERGGAEIIYTVEEEGVDGYTAQLSEPERGEDGSFTYTLTNSHEKEKVKVQATKKWNDSDNRDGKRSESVQVQLLADEEKVEDSAKTLNASNGWTATWEGLDKFSGREEITYSVEEVEVPADYESSVSEMTKLEDGTYAFTVTNSYQAEETNITVRKDWDDDGNRDALRPASVDVQLVADGTDVEGKTATLSADNWEHTWSNLPKNKLGDNGQSAPIKYTVRETTNLGDDYRVTYEDGAETGLVVKNTHDVQKTRVTVNKVWEDNNNFYQARPESISVQLLADGQPVEDKIATLSETSWSATWDDLPKNKLGNDGIATPIQYSVVESGADGYTPTITPVLGEDGNWTVTLTNAYESGQTSVSVLKVWQDEKDRDGLRPDSVSVQLYSNGTEYGEPVELTADNWTYTWGDLPEKAGGEVIEYTVEELGTSELEALGYESSVSSEGNVFTITNKREADTTEVSVKKVWADDSDREKVRPGSVRITLWGNDEQVDAIDLGAMGTEDEVIGEDEWSYTWKNLPVNDGGSAITYRVTEETPTYYEMQSSSEDGYSFTLTNTHKIATVNVKVGKIWNDQDDRDVVRPADVTVELYGDDQLVSEKTLSASTGWTETWSDLPKFSSGTTPIVYTIKEKPVAGYGDEPTVTLVKDADGNYSYTVENTHDVETTEVSVTKEWDDDDNADAVRPQSIDVQLYANGEPVANGKASLTEGGNWYHEWTGLPKNYKDANGEKAKIVYTVGEVGSVGDYTSTEPMSDDGSAFVIKNARETAKTSVAVKKEWNDDNNADNKRPVSVMMSLYAGDEPVEGAEVLELNEGNNWQASWTGLPKNKLVDGVATPIEYSVAEVEVPEGYRAEPDYTLARGQDESFIWTATNTRDTDKTSVSVHKKWVDDNDRDRVRPDSVTVQLRTSDGKDVGSPQVLNEANDWSYEWQGLPKNKLGESGSESIDYTVVETNPGFGYQPSVEVTKSEEDGTFQVEVTNKREVGKTSVTVVKDWQDDNNRDRVRPGEIWVQLKANGNNEGEAVKLSNDNSWTYTWENLNEKDAGNAIAYTVEELESEGLTSANYTSVVPTEPSGEGNTFAIVNSRETDKTNVTVYKDWDDDGNRDRKRPGVVTLTLYANGESVATHEVSAGENGKWSWTFEDLNVNDANGTPITYTVGEDVADVPEGYVPTTSEDGLTVINTHEVEKTKIEGQKQWVGDGNNQDGTRPDKITVVLKDGEDTVDSKEVQADDDGNWAYEFSDLDANRDGQPIAYTVEELLVPGYTSTVVNGVNLQNTLNVGQLKVTKSVENATTDRLFEFTVKLDNENVNGPHGDMVFNKGEATFQLRGGQAATATNLPAGVKYTVTEVEAAGYKATSNNAEGTIEQGRESVAAFTNEYSAEGKATFELTKTLEGRTLKSGDFQFAIASGGTVLQQKSNDGNGVQFEIDYTTKDLGSHEYTIYEVVPENAPDYMTYDETVYNVSTFVEDNGDGTLKVTYGGDYEAQEPLSFQNTYVTKGSVQLEAHKQLTGTDLTPERFTFFLTGTGITEPMKATNDKDGNVKFEAIEYDTPGTYEYFITEDHPEGEGVKQSGDDWVFEGMTYDGHTCKVKVDVRDNGDGTMQCEAVYDDGDRAEFTNKYEADGTLALVATKHMDGRNFIGGDNADEFTFNVEAETIEPEGKAAPVPERQSVTIRPTEGTDASVDFGAIEFGLEDVGATYKYTVSETAVNGRGVTSDPFTHTVTVKVTDNGKGELGIDATYSDGDGGMKFTNTYRAQGEAQLTAHKTLTGRDMKEGEFSFFLLDAEKVAAGANPDNDPSVVLQRVSADKDGNVAFAPLKFTQEDAGKDFKYIIREVNGGLGGVEYDTHDEPVTVHVEDKKDGTLAITYDGKAEFETVEFANTYTAESVSVDLEALKVWSGGELEDEQFEFMLRGTSENAADVNQKKSNDGEGKVKFDSITYNAPGTYTYEIAEVVPDGAVDNKDGTYRVGTTVYDGTAHPVTVTVTDNQNGKLEAEVSYDGAESLTVTNGVQLSHTGFSFDKYFFGGTGEFEFQLVACDADGNARAGEQKAYGPEDEIVDDGTAAFAITVKNGAFANNKAKVDFPEISFAADGDYYYLVSENEATTETMMTDEAKYLVHVEVSGGDVKNTTYELIYGGVNYGATTDLSFYNNSMVTLGFASLAAQGYTGMAEKTSVYPVVKKYLNGSTERLVGDDFQFELVSDNGAVIASATNDESGNVAFYDESDDEGLVFTEPGTYRYTIREVEGDQANVTYDKSEIILTVTVVEGDEGLEATMEYSGAVEPGSEPAFYNTVEGIDLTVQKVSRYGGEGLVDCTYALWMVGDNGDALIQEATSDENGFIVFKDVNLIRGERYYFKEVEAPAGHTVDPYRTAYFALNEAGDALVLVEETAADGWHSATENMDVANGTSSASGGASASGSGSSQPGSTNDEPEGVWEDAIRVSEES